MTRISISDAHGNEVAVEAPDDSLAAGERVAKRLYDHIRVVPASSPRIVGFLPPAGDRVYLRDGEAS